MSALPDGFLLREARLADGPPLSRIMGEAFRDYPRTYNAPLTEMTPVLSPRAWYRARHGIWWVAEDTRRGEVAGGVAYHPKHAKGRLASAELKHLYVAHWARRRGLGAALVRVFEEHARAEGCPAFLLWSDSKFEDAHRLYEALGWRRTGRERFLNDLSTTTEFEFVKP